MNETAIVLAEKVSSKILILRDQKVILDTDLAALYGVPVKRLNEQIKRNPQRFPKCARKFRPWRTPLSATCLY
jgi:hypothetical protein